MVDDFNGCPVDPARRKDRAPWSGACARRRNRASAVAGPSDCKWILVASLQLNPEAKPGGSDRRLKLSLPTNFTENLGRYCVAKGEGARNATVAVAH